MGQEVLEQNASSAELQKSSSTMLTHARHMYSKAFLLSVSKLEACKKVPAGLDSALLRETEAKSNDKGVAIPGASARGLIRTTRDNDAHSESPPDVPEWRRPSSLPGSPFLKQGPRQAESIVSSPRPGPARGGNPAQSIMGRSGSARWELRPGGVDRDRDLNQWESTAESGGGLHGRGFVRSGLVVSREHDGLLGSGGPIVNKGMIQSPTPDSHRAERASRAGRFGEQHHVTRGEKMSRISQYNHRDADSISDETFGSDDLPNGERTEQERQRRDEFEQMRRELRMKPLNISRNHYDDWLGESVQEALVSSSPGTPQSTSSYKDGILKPHNKAATPSSTPRLLVPPGFSKPANFKTGSPKENCEASKNPLSYGKDECAHVLKQTTSDDGVKLDKGEHITTLLQNIDKQLTSSPQQSPVISKFARWFPSQGSTVKESELNIEEQKPSLLVAKSEDLPPFLGTQSSLKPPGELDAGSDDAVLTKLSSIATLMPIDKKGYILPMPVGPSLEDVEKVMTASTDNVGIRATEERVSDRKHRHVLEDHLLPDGDKHDGGLLVEVVHPQRTLSKDASESKMKVRPVFVTCEDLEQTLLGETDRSGDQSTLKEVQQDTEKNINLMQLLQTGCNSMAQNNTSQQSWAVEPDPGKVMDGSASLHIMSLLQRRAGDSVSALPMADFSGKASTEAAEYVTGHDHRLEDAKQEGKHTNDSEIISLETLFGKSFVNELRSVGEPVSLKPVPDDPLRSDKEMNLLDVVLPSRHSNKGAGHGEAALIEDAGWDSVSHLNKGPKESETMQQGSGLQNESHHGLNNMKSLKELLSPRVFPIKGVGSADFRQRKSPPHPLNYSHPRYHEGRHVPTSEVSSHRLPFERVRVQPFVHDSPVYGMQTYGPNSPFGPYQEGFIRANNLVPAHFDERSSVMGGAYRMPSAFSPGYSEPVQMGFHPSLGMLDPRIGGLRIPTTVDGWFQGDPMQVSQVPSSYNPYQRHVPSRIQERKPEHGDSGTGVGLGVRSSNVDKQVHSETGHVPFLPGVDPYRLLGNRPGYG